MASGQRAKIPPFLVFTKGDRIATLSFAVWQCRVGVRSCRRPGCHLAQYKRRASITKTLSPGGNGRKHPPARARRPFPRTGLRRGGGPRVEEIGREGAAIISRKQAWQRRIWVIARRCHVRDLLCLHQELNVLPRRKSCIIHQGA
jgi:hypothetical protein